MKYPNILALLGICLSTSFLVQAAEPEKKSSSTVQPNVVVFLADDAGWGDYSFNGNQTIQTPNIDSIAKEGASFDRFYVCPVCAPTRAEFLTGRYHSRTGVYGVSTGQERINLDEKTVADAFKAAGYATGAFGKWHNGSQWPYHPMARGFDEYYGHSSGHWGEYFDPPLEHNGRMVREKGYIVDLCTNKALEFIDRNKEKPFFCYIPFTTPHSPWASPADKWEKFKNKEIVQKATEADKEIIDETRCALAMVENQDDNVGRVLDKLKQLGLSENTIVVYFTDNGPNTHRWNGDMKGKKSTLDEGGLKSPLFIRWPAKIKDGVTVKPIAGAIDLLPTLISLAGVERVGNKPLDGSDLSELLFNGGTTSSWPARTILSTSRKNISARTDRFRLDNKGQLYDMIADPAQTTAVNAKFPDEAVTLKKAVAQFREVVDQSIPARGDNKAVDPRPLPVGYREFPLTMLPARDGTPIGEVMRSSNAPNCSYFVNWKSVDDRLIWRVDIKTAGHYRVTIDHTCAAENLGAEITLTVGESTLSNKSQEAWDPPLYMNQDTLPRPKGESPMKDFRSWDFGEIQLQAGEFNLELKATSIPGKGVIDVRRINLELIN